MSSVAIERFELDTPYAMSPTFPVVGRLKKALF
jgi:hypothetical protein